MREDVVMILARNVISWSRYGSVLIALVTLTYVITHPLEWQAVTVLVLALILAATVIGSSSDAHIRWQMIIGILALQALLYLLTLPWGAPVIASQWKVLLAANALLFIGLNAGPLNFVSLEKLFFYGAALVTLWGGYQAMRQYPTYAYYALTADQQEVAYQELAKRSGLQQQIESARKEQATKDSLAAVRAEQAVQKKKQQAAIEAQKRKAAKADADRKEAELERREDEKIQPLIRTGEDKPIQLLGEQRIPKKENEERIVYFNQLMTAGGYSPRFNLRNEDDIAEITYVSGAGCSVRLDGGKNQTVDKENKVLEIAATKANHSGIVATHGNKTTVRVKLIRRKELR